MSHSTSRKISLGANSRRGPQKAHIPYRGDDLEHGKKTGKTVNQVSRDADDFEPFDQVLDQAYRGGNVPRATNQRFQVVNGHSLREFSPMQDDDDDSGELSMDIDSAHNSPSVYFNTAAAPQPSSAKRVGTASRPLPRRSNVDYDRVPSPKPSTRRSSVHVNSRPSNSSRLRLELHDDADVARGLTANTRDDPFDNEGVNDSQDEANYSDDGDLPGNDDPSPDARGNLSFTALARDEEDIPEDYQSLISERTDKGKGRAEVQENDGEEDVGIEEDIAVGLQEVNDAYEDEEQDRPGPSTKKPRRDLGPPENRPKKSQSKRTKRGPRISIYDNIDENGLRRSKRRHYPPLEYWRQEKVVWGRRERGRSVVPVIKEIITIPKPPPVPLGGKKRKRGATHGPRSKSGSVTSAKSPVEEVHVIEVDNPELGWDDDTGSHGIIIDWFSKEEVERRVACTSKMVAPRPAQTNNYSFQKIFGDNDFFAAGQLIIPPGEEKPAKPARDNTFVFYVIEGAVQVKVHRSSFVLASGGMFLVPRGNQYFIHNICQRDAKLFFAQARKVAEGQLEVAPDILPRMAAPSQTNTAQSSSRGVPSPKQRLPDAVRTEKA